MIFSDVRQHFLHGCKHLITFFTLYANHAGSAIQQSCLVMQKWGFISSFKVTLSTRINMDSTKNAKMGSLIMSLVVFEKKNCNFFIPRSLFFISFQIKGLSKAELGYVPGGQAARLVGSPIFGGNRVKHTVGPPQFQNRDSSLAYICNY